MKKIAKVLMFVFVIAGALTLSLNTAKAENNNEKNIKVKLMNSQVNTDTTEVIIRIKNNTSKTIKLKKAILVDGKDLFINLSEKEIKIKKGKTKYLNISFNQESGRYRMDFIFNKEKTVKTINLNVKEIKKEDKKDDICFSVMQYCALLYSCAGGRKCGGDFCSRSCINGAGDQNHSL